MHLEDCVSILGAKPHSEVFSWLDSIDIYVQPSFMEGLCRSIVEAMSRACPVICTNVGGNYELVSSDSFLKIQKRVYEKRKDCLINTKLISSVMMVRYLRYYGQTRFWMTDLYYVLKNKHK